MNIWIKILIFVALIIIVIVWSIILAMDKMMIRGIVDILKKEREENPNFDYLPLSSIIERIRSLLGNPKNWFSRFIQEKWILNKKHIRRRCQEATIVEESEDKKDYFGLSQRNKRIDSLFKWDDETIYEWEIKKEKTNMLRGAYSAFMAWLMLIAFVFIPLSLLEILSPWFSVVLAVFFLYEFISTKITIRKWKKSETEFKNNVLFKLTTDTKNKNLLTLSGASFFTGLFLYLLSSPIIPIESFFENYTTNKISWVLFSVQNIADIIFLDITEVLNFSFTTIRANTLVGRILAAMLNFLLVYSIVAIIISIYKSQAEKNAIYFGTVKDCHNWLMGEFRLDDDHKIICKGKLISNNKAVEIKAAEFVFAFNEDFDRDSSELYPFA